MGEEGFESPSRWSSTLLGAGANPNHIFLNWINWSLDKRIRNPLVAKLVDAPASDAGAHWACRFESDLGDQNFGGIAQSGRAPALQAGCRRFDPVYLHHFIAQMAERSKAGDCKPPGVMPTTVRIRLCAPSLFCPFSSVGRAAVLYSAGRPFESRHWAPFIVGFVARSWRITGFNFTGRRGPVV